MIKSYTILLRKSIINTMFPIIQQNVFISNKEKIEYMLTELKEWSRDACYGQNVVKMSYQEIQLHLTTNQITFQF